MREIKFRAWISDVSKMDYFDSFDKWASIEEAENFYIQGCDSDNILMQYTGLKDKNGKEIYEGDVVRIYDGSATPRIESVEFKNGCFVGNYMGWVWGMEKPHYLEIIGNIYENPELLKETP